MKKQFISVLKYIIGWPLTVFSFFYIFKIIFEKIPALLPQLHTINPIFLIYAVSSFLLFYFLRSYIWHRILRNFHYTLSFKESNYLWAISELKRYTPGNIWSFIGRTVLFKNKGVEKRDIGKGLIIEAELFVLGCLVVALLSMPLLLPYFSEAVGWLITLVAGAICFAYAFSKHIIKHLTSKEQKILHVFFPSFRPGEILILIGLSTLALSFFSLGNYFVMAAAIYTNPQLMWEIIGMFSLAFVVGYLSVITPAGFGVREGIVIFSLQKIISLGLAAFVSIFTRVMLIVTELVFIGISYMWMKLKSKSISRFENLVRARHYEVFIFVAALIYTIYFSIISNLRYDNFFTGRFDLGNMAQTVWNTLHGRIFLFTNPNGTEPVTRLAFHADFILVLLAPIYYLWQDPRMLLLIQTVVLAAGAFLVYYIAKALLKNQNLSFVFALAYLLNPSLQRANLYDFHPVTLATTFLLATYYFYMKKRYWLFVLFAVLAGLCKEQIWMILSFFGMLIFFHHKKRILGSAIFVVSLGIFYYLFWIAIPKALGSQHFALAYLSDFGDSPTKVLKSFLFSPQKLLQTINEPERLHFVRQLLSPLGYASVLFPFILIFAAPDLLIGLLSHNTQLHQIYYQYTATITPFIFISAIYGVWVMKKFLPQMPQFVFIFYILLSSLYAAYSFGPMPGSKEPNIDMITRPLYDREYITSFLSKIPKKYSISSTNNVGSHLSQRQKIYTIPLGIDKADMVIFLLTYSDSVQTIASEKKLLEKVKHDPQYSLRINRGNFYVFTKPHVVIKQ